MTPGTPYGLVPEQPSDVTGLAARLRCTQETACRISERLGAISDIKDRRDSHPHSPVAAMHRLVMLEDDMRARMDQFMRETADVYASILVDCGAERRSAPTSHEPVGERISGMPELRAKAGQLIASASDSVYAIAAAPDDDLLATEADVTPVDHVALAAGARLRKMYSYAILLDDDALKRAQSTADAGAEVRLMVRLPPQLVVIDGQTAIIPVVSAGRADGGVVIRQRTIVAAMMALFAECWEQGQPLTDTGTEPLSPAEMAVIKLLATGAKDDAIARQLGTSVRTIRRIVGNLMKRADVNSRFAFGVWAAYTSVC